MNQTKLSVFCDKLIEAGWLLAAVMAPLFFDVYSSRVFEPDKITLVRSLAVVMAAFWLIKMLETGIASGQGSGSSYRESWWERLKRWHSTNPLLWPTLFLVVAYLIATVFSVTPAVSLWGSYQRLQGTYSTFSYIVIAALVMATMRRREQVERLITVMLFTSLPASLYGLVQHARLEFLPWAGDVTTRVTSSMGNAIFIAAWLIMVVPLSLGRYIEAATQLWSEEPIAMPKQTTNLSGRVWAVLATLQGGALFLLVYEGLSFYAASQQKGEFPGPLHLALMLLALMALIVPFFLGIGRRSVTVLTAAAYLFLCLTQLATIFFSGSRGPWIGLLTGLFAYGAILTLLRRLRQGWYTVVGLGLVALIFLVAFNLPNSPLEPLKQAPYIGRLGSLLETEAGTGKVRILIWEGAIRMIKDDPFRTLVGYGPESMYVAYNRFYPPDLAHYEARNASPDRSHNETYDSLVITGVLGFFAYWTVFYAFFHFALGLLGLVAPRHRRWLYAAMVGTGIIAFAFLYAEVLPLALSPIFPLLGVAVLGGYLAFAAQEVLYTPVPGRRLGFFQGLVLAIFASVLAHFVEIQFGIAIASTRTYFWLFMGLTVVIGGIIARETHIREHQGKAVGESIGIGQAGPPAKADPPLPTAASKPAPEERRKGKKGKGAREVQAPPIAPGPILEKTYWWRLAAYALLAAVVLVTMVFDFVVPQQQATSQIVLWLIFGSWLFFCLLVLLYARTQTEPGLDRDFQNFLVCSLVTWAVVVAFTLFHPVRFALPGGVIDPSQFITYFYVWLGILMLAIALCLFLSERSLPDRAWQGPIIAWAYPLLLGAAIFGVVTTNLNAIIADIYYKSGDAYDKAGRWEGSIPAYQKALNLAPTQDFYFLFLGRAFMELSKRVPDAQRPPVQYTVHDLLSMRPEQLGRMSRQDMLNASLTALLEARRLNPLNTDHTANLGRLYRFWGEVGDPKMLDISLDYYRQATQLSPNTAHLYNEWGLVHFIKGQYQEALARFQKSASLDPIYTPTFVYLGDVYQALGQPQEALQAHLKAIELEPGSLSSPQYFSRPDPRLFEARLGFYQRAGLLDRLAEKYKELAAKDPKSFPVHYAMGFIYFTQGQSDQAVQEFQQAERLNKDDIATHSILGYLYAQQGRLQDAVQQNLEVLRLAPNDLNSHRNLAILYQRLGQIDRAISETQAALKLAPNDAALQDLLKQLTGGKQ